MVIYWTNHRIVRILTTGGIPQAKQFSCKEISRVWMKNVLDLVIETRQASFDEQVLFGHQDTKPECIYRPQWFIECFNNTSVHQLIHSQKWQVPKKFTSTLSKSKYILFCSIQQSSVWGDRRLVINRVSVMHSDSHWSFCTKTCSQ